MHSSTACRYLYQLSCLVDVCGLSVAAACETSELLLDLTSGATAL